MLRRSLKRRAEETKCLLSKKTDSESKTKKKVLGNKQKEDHKEKVLKGIVFGDEDEMIQKLGDVGVKQKKKHSRKKILLQEEERTPAWEDDDDENSISLAEGDRSTILQPGESITGKTYTKRLEGQFKKVMSRPDWAQLGYRKKHSDDDDSDVEDLVRTTGDYLTKSSILPNATIQVKQCTNANRECPTKGKLNAVEFHPSAQVILTAGMDQTLNFFQVDGKTNPKIQGVFLDNFPISTAHFSNKGQEVILGSWMRTFYCYDMIAGKAMNIPKIKGLEGDTMSKFKVSPDGQFLVFLGKYGYIHILCAKSKEWIQTLKMNGTVMSIAFSSDGSKMFSFGDEGCVYVWDMNTRDCVHKFFDDGCFRGTTISTSPNNQYLCCGSYSGVVNIYEVNKCLAERYPKPERCLGNLTTCVNRSIFNSSSEILGLTSDGEAAIRLVHLPSCQVFSNFPDPTDRKIRYPKCLDFSLNSGYLAIGNHKGHALLYRLKHYDNY